MKPPINARGKPMIAPIKVITRIKPRISKRDPNKIFFFLMRALATSKNN